MNMELNAIKSMERIARTNSDVISLGQGIPSLPLDGRIRQAVMLAMFDGRVDSYSDPQGVLELREKIAMKLRDDGMDYGPNEVVVTAGAIEALNVSLRSVVTSEKCEVIVPTPVYAAYFRVIETARGVSVPLQLLESDHWELDVDKMKDIVTPKTAAILLCNPNNPTGSVYDQSTLESIMELARDRGITVIIDEVYKNMLYTPQKLYTPAMNPAYKGTVIRVVSFSKDFSLTGWRIGFLHADEKRISNLVAIHDALINCAPVISQYAAMAAIDIQDEILERNIRVYTRHRDSMARHLDELSDYLTYDMPTGGYFFFPRYHGSMPSSEFALKLAHNQKLVVVPGSAFGAGGENHFRLCFGRSIGEINQGMERLRDYFDKN